MSTTTVTVTAKGQISIPARIRKRLRIEKGVRLRIEERGDEIVLTPLTPEYLDRMAGILRGPESLSQKLLQGRQEARERES
jgi:AbrB family looped-hinge helix DNA binding protein